MSKEEKTNKQEAKGNDKVPGLTKFFLHLAMFTAVESST